MTAIVTINNLDPLEEQLEKIAYSLDSIASTLAYLARMIEKKEESK